MTSCSYPIITNIYIQLIAASFEMWEEQLSRTSEQNKNGNSGRKHLFPNLQHLSHIPHCSIHLFVSQPLNQSSPIVLHPRHARVRLEGVAHRLVHSRAQPRREIVIDKVFLPFSLFEPVVLTTKIFICLIFNKSSWPAWIIDIFIPFFVLLSSTISPCHNDQTGSICADT